ncbi:MAG: type III secretion system export apparatus subunit SctT [Desulfovibrionaceae bacterium]|nr:type III secretion system export apparatus subunit SctT [Desulfovibrionaceae bacterium]
MDLQGFLQNLDILPHLSAFLLGMPRLFAVALVAPFLGTGVLEGQIWFVLVLGLYLPMHPCVFAELTPALILSMQIDPMVWLNFACVFVKEVVIGLGLGLLAGLPFWAIQDAGIYIDNQRGAAQSESTEILTGKSASPMGGLLFECIVYLFYQSGAFLTFLGVIYASYLVWPVTQMLPLPTNYALPLYFASKVAWLMTFTILLSAPITVACLLVDISLGLINRFSPQLNAYVLAMPIKSGLAAVLLTLYLALLLHFAQHLFQIIYIFINPLHNLILNT